MNAPTGSGLSKPTAQWYPDPQKRHQFRYWDGEQWTSHVSDNGVVSIDVVVEPTPSPNLAAATTAADSGPAAPSPTPLAATSQPAQPIAAQTSATNTSLDRKIPRFRARRKAEELLSEVELLRRVVDQHDLGDLVALEQVRDTLGSEIHDIQSQLQQLRHDLIAAERQRQLIRLFGFQRGVMVVSSSQLGFPA